METKQILLLLLFVWIVYNLFFSREGFFVNKYDCSRHILPNQCGQTESVKNGCMLNPNPEKNAIGDINPLTRCICNDPKKCTDKRGNVRGGSVKDYMKSTLNEMQKVENEYVSLKNKTDTEAMNKKKELETKYGSLMADLKRWQTKK